MKAVFNLWSNGTLSMVVCAVLFAVSALCVKLMQDSVPVFEVRTFLTPCNLSKLCLIPSFA
jgi:hypothetical protein